MIKFIKKLKLSTLGILLSSALLLAGCVEAIIASAVVATVDIMHDRRSTGTYFDDSGIEIEMRKFLHGSKRIRSQAHVNPTSFNGIVLLTGESTSEQMKQEVADYANSIYGVRQVIDETRVSGKTGLLSRSNDTWITSKVKTNLIARMGTTANRIKVVTEFGHVYLMGLVTQEEADKATDITRSVGAVVRVVRAFEIKQ